MFTVCSDMENRVRPMRLQLSTATVTLKPMTRQTASADDLLPIAPETMRTVIRTPPAVANKTNLSMYGGMLQPLIKIHSDSAAWKGTRVDVGCPE